MSNKRREIWIPKVLKYTKKKWEKKSKMDENIHRVRTLENKEDRAFKWWLEEWKKIKNFCLGVRTTIVAFEWYRGCANMKKMVIGLVVRTPILGV